MLPATQLPPALETQAPPESVKPAAQPQTASELAVQAEMSVWCAPVQVEQVAHGVEDDALHVLPAVQALATQLPPVRL